MKKALSLVAILALVFTLSLSVLAVDDGTVYKLDFQNVCTSGDFESIAGGTTLPLYEAATDERAQKDPTKSVENADLTSTGNWFSNLLDAPGTIVEGEGYQGSKALKITAGGFWCGAAYWHIPHDMLQDKEIVEISFLYKFSDAYKANCPEFHGTVMTGSVYSGGTDWTTMVKKANTGIGLENYVGQPWATAGIRFTGPWP